MAKKMTKQEQELYLNSLHTKGFRFWTNFFILLFVAIITTFILGILALLKFLVTYLVG